MKILNNKIKLVIWDLDDTFWDGTLSEGAVIAIDKNNALVKELTDRGIINSISSKNNHEDAEEKLRSIGIWDYFVFPQITWDPKGKVIKDLLEILSLREENVLFIDDNILNLNEALFFCPKLNVCLPEYIDTLLESEHFQGKDDSKHMRLAQYKNLEKKQIEFSKSRLSNVEFLKESEVKVQICTDCINEIARLHELVERTNQLNYTKKRLTLEEIIAQINDSGSSAGYIRVTDKYGDYGISGFYLIKDNELVHFLFSCRTMNMYIESWVYKQLGCPKLEIVGDVAMQLDLTEDLSFINSFAEINKGSSEKSIKSDKQLLMVGGCDLDQVVYYLNYKELQTEFNYVSKLNLDIRKDHTYIIKQFNSLDSSKADLIRNIPILDTEALKINSQPWDILIFSPLTDYSRGLYRHKASGFILPFDAFNINWTEEKNWVDMPKHLTTLPKSFLEFLKKEFDFIGAINLAEFEANINWLLEKYNDKKFVFLNGSEVVFENGKYWEKNMHERHIQMNAVLNTFKSRENVRIIDVTKIVKTESDITDNIRHYNKIAYKHISDEIIKTANDWMNEKLKSKNSLHVAYDTIIRKFNKKLKEFE